MSELIPGQNIAQYTAAACGIFKIEIVEDGGDNNSSAIYNLQDLEQHQFTIYQAVCSTLAPPTPLILNIHVTPHCQHPSISIEFNLVKG